MICGQFVLNSCVVRAQGCATLHRAVVSLEHPYTNHVLLSVGFEVSCHILVPSAYLFDHMDRTSLQAVLPCDSHYTFSQTIPIIYHKSVYPFCPSPSVSLSEQVIRPPFALPQGSHPNPHSKVGHPLPHETVGHM